MFIVVLLVCAFSTLGILTLAVAMVRTDQRTSAEISRAGQEYLARRNR
jgi:hypothetical protein